MPLHISRRPKALAEVAGNKSIKDSLESIFAREDKPHAYLFSGPSGTGKTTFGRVIANMLRCSDTDLYEFNNAESRGIDTVREIMQNCQYAPMNGKVRVYILDEIHRATKDLKEALLKLLEDPPSHVYFILCTTAPDELPKTIHTRCTSYQTKSLLDSQMKNFLIDILEKEKVNDFSEKVLNKIVGVSEGSPRQALVILDQVIDILDEEAALEAVATISFGEASVREICQILLGKADWKEVRAKLVPLLKENEPESLRYAVLGYMTAVLLNSNNHKVSDIIDLFSEPTFNTKKAGIVQAFFLACQSSR